MQTLNRTPTLGVHHNGDGGHHAGDGSNHVGDVGDHRDGGGGADDADHRDADVAGQLLESGDLVLLVPHGICIRLPIFKIAGHQIPNAFRTMYMIQHKCTL